MADSMLMYAITAGVFVIFAIILGSSRAKRYRQRSAPVPSSESKKVRYSSDGKPLSD
ncbi:MAG TPA: hypothetical protein VH481_02375 [Nitrososphaeraceae archaeon]|jgi:hypothetical protein